MTLTIIVVLIILTVAGIIYLLGRETTLALIFGPADQGRIVFQTFKRSRRPNNALICPANFCTNATPEEIAPEFDISAEELREVLRKALNTEFRLDQVHVNDPAMRERYVQRSELFRFPDTIQVEYIPLPEDRSTIALYSRSQIGYRDYNVNLKRLRRWIRHLNEAVEQKASH